MASNRRIRGDCGSVGTPIERDPQNQADFPSTPVLPLIESPNTDSLFTWARNMTMSLEDWFNLLSQAVYDGDDQLQDLYDCFCIRLCPVDDSVPCGVYECDAYDSAVLSGGSVLSYTGTDEAPNLSPQALVDKSVGIARNAVSTTTAGPYLEWTPCGGVDNFNTTQSSSYVVTNNGGAPAWENDPGFCTGLDDATVHGFFRWPYLADGVDNIALAWNLVSYELNMAVHVVPDSVSGATVKLSWVGSDGTPVNQPKYESTAPIPEMTMVAGDIVWFGVHVRRYGASRNCSFDYDIYYSDLQPGSSFSKVASGSVLDTGQLWKCTEIAEFSPFNVTARIELGAQPGAYGQGLIAHMQRLAVEAGELSDAKLLSLADGYARTFADYVDPNPACQGCRAYSCSAYKTAALNINPLWLIMTDEAENDPVVDATGQVAYVGGKVASGTGYLAQDGLTPCSADSYVLSNDTYDLRVVTNRVESPEWYNSWDDLSVHTLLELSFDAPAWAYNLVQFQAAIASTSAAQAFGLNRNASGTRIQVWNFNWAVGGWLIQSTPYLPELDAIQMGNIVPIGLHFRRTGTRTPPNYFSLDLTIYVNHEIIWEGSFNGVASTKADLGLTTENFSIRWSERNQTWAGLGHRQSHTLAKAGKFTAADMLALKNAYEENRADFVDPNTECGTGVIPGSVVPVYPTPLTNDVMVYDEVCGGWNFEPKATGSTNVYFQVDEPLEAVEGDFWSTTV